jgi:uncharacterized membrane protein
MNKSSLQLLIAVFEDEQGAEQAIKSLQPMYKEKQGAIQAAVAIVKDRREGIHYKDVGLTPAKGALGGVILGVVLGVATGGAGIALGTLGALVGGLLGGKRRGEQFSEVRLNEVIAALAPGTSAIVAVVEQENIGDLEQELYALNAETFVTQVSADLAEELEERQHTAFSEWIDTLDQ